MMNMLNTDRRALRPRQDRRSLPLLFARTAVAPMLMLAGCGDGNELSGSIEELIPIDFSETKFMRQADVFVAEYINHLDDGSIEIVLRFSFDTAGLDIRKGKPIFGQDFVTHTHLQRASRDNLYFPNVEGGRFEIEEFNFEDGGKVRGEFDVAFVIGRMLLGKFEGVIE